ncbi:MAG: hypothetical protein WD771_10635 [Gemmatimonadaceae bacterium]
MPLVPFDTLPDDARLWVFGARAPLDDVDAPRLLGVVDGFLKSWKAHDNPLTCARDFREEYFLLVAVDERASDASGCSIDGLFRLLKQAEEGVGTSLVGGGTVYFRDKLGLVHAVSRADFQQLAATGEVNAETPVFDTTLTSVGELRSRFERPARESWHADLLPTAHR